MEQYFRHDKDEKKVFFTGDTLEVFIPDRYRKYGCLYVEESVLTMGIFDMVIDGNIETGYFLPAMIRMEPSGIDEVKTGAGAVVKLTLHEGDLFMTTEIVRNPTLAYSVFSEFIEYGKVPDFLTYTDKLFMFDIASEVTGMKFGVDHSIFEIIMAYIHRDSKDYSQHYRLTSMNQEPTQISLNQVPVLAESTTSKLLGSQFDAALDSAMVNKAEESSELEEILRK